MILIKLPYLILSSSICVSMALLACERSSEIETSNPQSDPVVGEFGESVLPGEVEGFRPDGWGYASHSKGAQADYERIFPDDAVQRIDIIFEAEDYQAMQDNMVDLYGNPFSGGGSGGQPSGGFEEEPEYFPVTVHYAGLSWWNVGMRYKGNSSLRGAWSRGKKKIPFRLDFDEFEDTYPEIDDQRFYGFKKLTFSSGYKDNSLMREKLGAEIFRDANVKVARSSFYRVYLDIGNGDEPVYAGLYTMVEDVSNKFLDEQFVADTGNLYKPDGGAATWQYFDEEDFIKKTNEEDGDWSDIEAAIAALHSSQLDAVAWRSQLERYFNVESYLNLLAVNQVIQNWDTYGSMTHNYYLYGDPGDNGRLLWIPWDLNECMLSPGGSGPGGRSSSILLNEVDSRWPVIRFLLDDPIYAAYYHSAILAVVDGPFALDKVTTRMRDLHDLLSPYVVGADGEKEPYTLLEGDSAFQDSLISNNNGLIPHVEYRHQLVDNALEALSNR